MNSYSIAIVVATLIYIIVVLWIGVRSKKHTTTGSSFASGGRSFPAWLLCGMMLTEFIGSSISIGTAQKGYTSGISSAWALFGYAIGILLFGLIMAKRYRASGHNTVSGVLSDNYGEGMRYAASVLSIVALSIVSVALYAGGGALLASVLGIGKTEAIILSGVVTVALVAMGGLRSVVYTNFMNTILKAAGITLILGWAIYQAGGLDNVRKGLPPHMFDINAVGIGQIISWIIAGVGSIFATQYVVQAIVQTSSDKVAKRACNYTFILMIPFGIALAAIGVCSAYLYPGIPSIRALPEVVAHMPTWAACIAVIGIIGSMFGAVSATVMGSATLFTQDIFNVFFNQSKNERNSLLCARIATIVMGIAPVILALSADQILALAFLGKALRATLAVFILLSFYAPGFGTREGAVIGVGVSIIATISWYLAGNPWGIDSTYIAFLSPIVAMSISHLFNHHHSASNTLK